MSDEYKAAEQLMLADEVAKADILLTTALIPGRAAPILVPESMVAGRATRGCFNRTST